MKRSLAPPRRDKPAGGSVSTTTNTSSKKLPVKVGDDRGHSIEKSSHFQIDLESDKNIPQKYQQRYRNKNLNALPTPLLVALSTLTTLDISYNKLTDSQIQLIMNSCTKLSTLCIQGNVTTLIPASIGKLKLLLNFRHDWVKLSPQDMYEPEKRLDKIRDIVKKPDIVTKINRIVGLDFMGYCLAVMEVPIDRNLLEKVEKCDCSSFAKENMMKYFQDLNKGRIKQKERLVTINEGIQKALLPGCFGICHFEDRTSKKQQKAKEIPARKDPYAKQAQSEAQTDAASTQIKIEDIRDITQRQLSLETNKIQSSPPYQYLNMPLHYLFSNFDKNPSASAQIDGLLLRGYNPNQYDPNGLSPYHLCVTNNQKKGLEYLLDISSNNPGFFDLEMPSMKEGRNILHYGVFLKNYPMTKLLIQFGLPIDKRDSTGARLIHLVDQNYEFLTLLRKLLKKRTTIARNVSALSVPPIPVQNKRNYVKHPQRQREQSRFRITYSKNQKLLEMFQTAVGFGPVKI